MTANHTPASPLLDEHRSLGATLIDFAGWAMPLKYGSELAEHRAVRERAGLFDLSHMGEIAVTETQSPRRWTSHWPAKRPRSPSGGPSTRSCATPTVG
jgi:glycine cleavage system aminomethyltransferase T